MIGGGLTMLKNFLRRLKSLVGEPTITGMERKPLKILLNNSKKDSPLVTKVHLEAVRFTKEGYTLILIGHPGHDEVEGTMGEAPMRLVSSVEDVETLQVSNPDKVIFLTQTTLSLDDTAHIVQALRRKFPNMQSPPKDDICYATQNRQDAIKTLAQQCDVVIVVGSPNSSNSNRLREVAANQNTAAYMIDNARELKPEWLTGKTRVGVTAGASAPEVLVQEVIARLKELGASKVEEVAGITEHVTFPLPKNLII